MSTISMSVQDSPFLYILFGLFLWTWSSLPKPFDDKFNLSLSTYMIYPTCTKYKTKVVLQLCLPKVSLLCGCVESHVQSRHMLINVTALALPVHVAIASVNSCKLKIPCVIGLVVLVSDPFDFHLETQNIDSLLWKGCKIQHFWLSNRDLILISFNNMA